MSFIHITQCWSTPSTQGRFFIKVYDFPHCHFQVNYNLSKLQSENKHRENLQYTVQKHFNMNIFTWVCIFNSHISPHKFSIQTLFLYILTPACSLSPPPFLSFEMRVFWPPCCSFKLKIYTPSRYGGLFCQQRGSGL